LKLSFHGADRGVTGSCHLIECARKRILIDCGMYQGGRELDEENARPFGFDANGIDYVLLTHAHLDHCGRLPLLAKRGFRGKIVATAATRDLARLVMLDSANLQEEDVRYQARAGAHHRATRRSAEPLYTVEDAERALDRFGKKAVYGRPIDLARGIRATFFDAGHIFGSASVLLELAEDERRTSVLFSGDLGQPGGLILAGPAKPPHADAVVMETTYGDREHKPLEPSIEEFYGAVTDTFARGGNVVVPTFALERAQELLYVINRGIERNRLPPSIQVFLDSPMAASATEIMERNLDVLQPEIADRIRGGRDPFHFPGLRFTHGRTDSIALNEIETGAVILAGSGMCTGGRVRFHLKRNLGRPESSVVFVGYAAAGTLARRIIDGAGTVDILGERIPVKAGIYTINGFSAHAGQSDLKAWHERVGAGRTFLVHGEEKAMASFAASLGSGPVEMPEQDQAFEL
jgi:metallo-beta-lactamase family protein